MAVEDDDVEAALAVLRRRLETAPKSVQKASPTVTRLNDRYWREYARHQKSARDKKRIGDLLVLRFGAREALSLTTEDCESYRDWRRERPTRLGEVAKPATINHELSQLRHLLNWAARLRLLPYNPVALVKMEREHNVQRTKVRSEEDLDAILVHCNQTMAALVLVLVDAGLRRMEGIDLRWDEFDHRTGVLELFDTKNDEPRRPRLSKRSLAAVLKLPRISPWVFANWRRGPWYAKRIDPSTALKAFQRAAKQAGVVPSRGESWTLHKLRHTFLYRSRVRDKLPEKMVMKQSGHRTRAAFDRYGIGDDLETEEMFKVVDANIAQEMQREKERKAAHRALHVVKSAEGATDAKKTQGPIK